MPYEFDQIGLENQIEDHIYQLMERFNASKALIRKMVEEVLENYDSVTEGY